MKKQFAVVTSVLLCMFLLLGTFGAVSAKSMTTAAGLPDPTVTPVSGNTKFDVELLSMLDLPGETTLSSGMPVPVGFPAGEKQFEGKGVQVSGFTYGVAKACFPVTAVNQGWGGKVASWDGSKWEFLSTTITAQEETPYSLACADILADGTYAFISWVVDPSKLPTNSGSAVCKFGIDYQFSENYGYAFGPYMGLDVPASVPNGTPVTYSVIKIDPTWSGTFVSGLSGSTTVGDYSTHAAIFNVPVVFSMTPGPVYTARIEFPTLKCHVDLVYYGAEIPYAG
jgi:hypothetical protein